MELGNKRPPGVGRRASLGWFAAATVAPWLVAPARAAAPLVIGQVAPFTGAQAVTGKAISAGIRLCFDAVNAAGGIDGQPLKLVTRDDLQKPEETVRLVKELIAAESPLALVGTVGTANLEALAKEGVLTSSRLSMVGAISGANSVVSASNIHIVKASYADEVGRLFKQLSMNQLTRVGVLFQEDGYGRDVIGSAQMLAKQHGIDLVVQSGYARNTVAVEKAVAAIVAANVQVVLMAAVTAPAIAFVKQYAAAGGKGTIYGLSVIDTDALLKALGPDRARGYAFSVVTPLAQKSNLPLVRDYLQLRQASKDPDLLSRSLEGFIAARALVKVLQGIDDPTPGKLTQALNTARSVDIGGYLLNFSDDKRAGSRYVDFAMFGADGRIVQ